MIEMAEVKLERIENFFATKHKKTRKTLDF